MILGLSRGFYRVIESGQASASAESSSQGTEDLTGDELPLFAARTLDGNDFDNTTLAGKSWAALFISPDCTACMLTLEELNALLAKSNHRVVVFCRSNEARCREITLTYGIPVPVIVDTEYQYSRLFRVAGSPTAVLVGPDGFVEGYGQPAGDDLEEVLESYDSTLRAQNASQ